MKDILCENTCSMLAIISDVILDILSKQPDQKANSDSTYRLSLRCRKNTSLQKFAVSWIFAFIKIQKTGQVIKNLM